jgi:hypothetical protein
MRRVLNLLLLSVVAVLFVLPAQVAAAQDLPADRFVVATQAELPEDFPGTTPGDPNAEDNAFAPEDYEANFLWGAAVGLTVLVILGVGGVGLLYWGLVVRPKQQASTAA